MADKGDYNPYENRNVESPLSNFGAFVTLMNCVIGTGILALPVAFYYAGIVNGIVQLIVITLMLLHGMHLLIYSMVECSRRMQVGYATYPESLVYSFRQGPDSFKSCAKAGGYFVDVVLALFHYGVCVVYLVFVASNLKHIVDFYCQPLNVRVYVIIVGLFSIPVFLIRSLKWLVPFNLLSVIFSYSGYLVMFYYLVTGLPSLSDRYIVFGDVKNMGHFFGIVLYSFSSMGVMLLIEAKMARPQDYLNWFGILDLSIFVVSVSYILFGFFGYWRYGDQVVASVYFYLKANQPVAQVSFILIAAGIFLTYPLSGHVVIDIIMRHYWNRKGQLRRRKRKETMVRVVFVLLTTVLGVLCPNLGPVLTLASSISISALTIIFPALMEICLYYPPGYSYGRCKWLLAKDLTLVLIGTFILIEGSVFSLVSMIDEHRGFSSKNTKGTGNATIAYNTTIGATGAPGATTALEERAPYLEQEP